MRRRFFLDSFSDGMALLEGDAAHHLANVLRVEPGQLYELSDGHQLFLGRVERVARTRVEFALVEALPTPAHRLHVTLLLALVKFDRFEWALEKATELGAETVIPLAAERSEKKLVEAAVKRADRWNRILLESAQQARALRPPQLPPAQRPAEAFRAESHGAQFSAVQATDSQALDTLNTKDAGILILLSERSGAPPLREILRAHRQGQDNDSNSSSPKIVLAVGPEGGWTDAELAAASAAGFCQASLGDLILRTETAVIAGLSAVLLYFQSAK